MAIKNILNIEYNIKNESEKYGDFEVKLRRHMIYECCGIRRSKSRDETRQKILDAGEK